MALKCILGIDPGSVITGYGVIESDGIRDFHIANGSIKVAGDSLPEKLGYILYEIGNIIDRWGPCEAGVEEVFVSKNPSSALKLGQARGAAICAAVQRGLPVFEYSARRVKQSVVGYGAADKQQMQQMIGMLLSLPEQPRPDAADGLAVALCHAHTAPTVDGDSLVRPRSGRRRSKRWVSVP